MEVHVGSIDEEDDEQGIAHMIEHVAFLGSKKREKLLGTGARSNAYTDFHHTVFHIHSPTSTKDSDGDLLPSVLDALNEIAFHPKFLASRVEKERRAILSELQMMNTIEYRVDCQLLQHLHSENKLSKRFPIGLEEQIKKWDADKIRKFHERWYFPANATLYIVGDIDNISKAVNQIEAVFGETGLENEAVSTPNPSAFGAMASFLVPKISVGLGGSLSNERSNSVDQSKIIKKERHAIRPPVKHYWSLPGSNVDANPPQIFQHELLQNFSINMFCKIPVNKVRTFSDLRNVLMKRIFLSALHFRINTRYKSSNPPFTSIELDHSDSGREGCTVTTLTVTAEPKNWQSAIKVAVQEVRRLKEFGVTKGELTRYMDALLKDSEHLAAMIDNVSSVDNLDFIMESDALGHTVMDQRQGHESLVAVAGTVTLEEVNSIGAEVLEFISDYGKPTAPLPAAIVACVPKKAHIDGLGETEFKITASEIITAIEAGLREPIEAEPELEVPKELISSSQIVELRMQHQPSFVPLNPETNVTKFHDKETGITQCRLSNGIPVNYKISKSENKAGVMRLIVGGGRAAESPDSQGAVVVGVRTLSEGGRVGTFSREQVELFCVNHLINCSLESTEEFIAMEFRFTLRDNGMRAAFQLLHMVLEHSVWLEDAFDRAKQLYMSYYRSIPKSLERSTAHKLMLAMLNGDERFVEPSPKSLQNLTLQTVKDAVMNQFVGNNMEVSLVGDFSEEEIESCILDYLGTVTATKTSEAALASVPIVFRPSASELQFQQVFLKDTDERACAYISGPAPNRWGVTFEGLELLESVSQISRTGESDESDSDIEKGLQRKLRSHPLFFGITMGLLAEIINSRQVFSPNCILLFTSVRDSLGLTYDVSFELSLFDRLKLGWYVISVTSTPAKVYKAVDACKSVLRGLHSNKIAQRELDRAKRTLLMRHEAEIKSNAYWLGLLAHLQASSVPRKDLSCIKDLTSLYEAATIDDVYIAYDQLKVDADSLYTCIGIAGAQAGEESIVSFEEEGSDQDFQGVIPSGRGLSTMTRPTT
ncbi:stromal processing peptidase [Cucumis melo var. makuwa]|uniref:Stromal processing peptidase n=1 Tax=Cucumis melo var. makuwa TaxID=1194695 RepID=A0A5A7U266_CUCMM|nr:stromal processing peptidase [Cucumis melo var. makuwa]TYK08337.1 stromal processing peptidase [Cucumis melo var. makuwa]